MPSRLGFIIDDVEPSPSIDGNGDAVDLYGYLSMTVATVQAQANDMNTLKREINDLRRQLPVLKSAAPPSAGLTSGLWSTWRNSPKKGDRKNGTDTEREDEGPQPAATSENRGAGG